MPDPIGRACLVPDLGYPAITAVDVSIWRPNPEIADPQFLVYALSRSEWFNQVFAVSSGATRPRISRSVLEEMTAPIPPLVEQRHVVSVLDKQLHQADRARAAVEARADAASLLRSAVLRSAFSEGSSKSWPVVNLESVSEIVSGVTLGRRPPVGSTRAVQYLTVANVKDGYLNLEDVRSIEITDSELEKWRLESGDLLLTEGGDPDKLGRGTIWREEIPNCIHQNHIFRVRFRTSEVLPEFAAAQASSPYGKAYFFAHAKQTTGIATINQRVLRAFPFLRPPMPEQERIVADLRARSEEIERLRRHADTELQAVKALPAALLRQAFTGEL